MKLFIGLFLAASVMLTGCGKEYPLTSESAGMTIPNGDRQLSFEKTPTRLLTLRQHITETALAIDLDPYIVGASSVIDPPLEERFKERYAKLPIIAEIYPSQEVLFAANPDLIWVDRQWAFVKNKLGPMENIEANGTKVYLSESAYHNKNSMEYTYQDILRMGKIFGNEKNSERDCCRYETAYFSDIWKCY